MQPQTKMLAIGMSQLIQRIFITQEPILPLNYKDCKKPVVALDEVVVVATPPSPHHRKKPHSV